MAHPRAWSTNNIICIYCYNIVVICSFRVKGQSYYLAISVLVSGVARIVDGIHKESKRVRIFVTIVGIINVVVSVIILLNPSSGAVMAGRAVSLLLLISGIQMLVSGLASRKRNISINETKNKVQDFYGSNLL